MKQQFLAGVGTGLLLAAVLYGALNAGQTQAQPERNNPLAISRRPAAAVTAAHPAHSAHSAHAELAAHPAPATHSATAAQQTGAGAGAGKQPAGSAPHDGSPVGVRAASVRVVIAAGLSVQTIANLLLQAGVIRSSKEFVAMAEREPFLRAGVYEFHRNEPLSELLYALTVS
ncbi:MAG: hypothetical protein ACYCYO_11490 [Bacilli bacterium]